MINVCTPLLGRKELKYLETCIRENYISSSGRFLNQFEDSFSAYCGAKQGIATTNGTAALHLALSAAGIQKGDEVIMPSFTICSTAFAAIYCGAKPVFVDSEPDTWNIDPQKIESKITRRTKAILPVHIYGHPCEMKSIMKIAKKHGLTVIEDAAEAHGAEYEGKKVGGIGHIGCFSFYSNKIITCGEGGMVVTNNQRIADICRRRRNLSFIAAKRFLHKEIGFNYRMTNLQAALGLAQFEQIDAMIKRRRRNAMLYNGILKEVPGIQLPVERKNVKNVYWMYSILIHKEFGISRDELAKKLWDHGIETRTFFVPMHRQPILRKMGYTSKERFPVSDDIARKGLYLPSGSGLKKSQIKRICDVIRKVQRRLYVS